MARVVLPSNLHDCLFEHMKPIMQDGVFEGLFPVLTIHYFSPNRPLENQGFGERFTASLHHSKSAAEQYYDAYVIMLRRYKNMQNTISAAKCRFLRPHWNIILKLVHYLEISYANGTAIQYFVWLSTTFHKNLPAWQSQLYTWSLCKAFIQDLSQQSWDTQNSIQGIGCRAIWCAQCYVSVQTWRNLIEYVTDFWVVLRYPS